MGAAADDPAETRRTTNPLFNDNTLKLGTFATNVSGGATSSTADGVFQTTWPNVLQLAHIAERGGFEALVPVARWRGFGGPTNFNGANFETYTWAAGLAAATRTPALFATSHVPTIHPIVAAKQATTIDHISGGRFALNVVCGWFAPEFQMFGSPIMSREARYEYAGEWLDVVKLLWTREDEFDFEGKYFKIEKGFHQPKPIQQPFPPVMNAGFSQDGHHFACKYCDIAFIGFRGADMDAAKAQIKAFRDFARAEYNRDIQIWINAYVVQGDNEAEAKREFDYIVEERGDWEAIDNLAATMGLNESMKHLSADAFREIKRHFVAGWGGVQIVGTADQVAQRLAEFSAIGIDGCLISSPRYAEGLTRFVDETVPRLVQAGLRKTAPAA